MKIGAAPISWGVCEVPGWGPMLDADRVLREMNSLGLFATELGAPGFLPPTGPEVLEKLAGYNTTLLGGFVPLVLHDSAQRDAQSAEAEHWASLLAAGGSSLFISAIVVDAQWSPRRALSDAEWSHMFMMFDEVDAIAKSHGLLQVLHPHVGTLVETAEDVQRVLDDSGVAWCLDTGHLAIGGVNPVEFATKYSDRVGHVHLKEVDMAIAKRLNDGELSLMNAVFAGLFPSLGRGDVDVSGVMRVMESVNYDGWYVLEQDCSIVGDAPPEGSGPVEDVAVSLEFIRLHRASAATHTSKTDELTEVLS